MTDPKYFFTNSGWLMTASEKEQKIIPCFDNSFLKVVATDTLSNTASTATPSRRFCSFNEIPNLLYVSIMSGSTSSRLAFFLCLGAA